MASHLRNLHYLFVTWLAAMLLGTAGHAQLPQPGKNAIAASLIPESAVVVPGETVTLALMMRPSPGWHGYWKNPGDSGIETQIAWKLPAGRLVKNVATTCGVGMGPSTAQHRIASLILEC